MKIICKDKEHGFTTETDSAIMILATKDGVDVKSMLHGDAVRLISMLVGCMQAIKDIMKKNPMIGAAAIAYRNYDTNPDIGEYINRIVAYKAKGPLTIKEG